MWKFATTTNNPPPPQVAGRKTAALIAAFALAVFAAPPPAVAQIFTDDVARETAATNLQKLEDLARIVENLRSRLGAMAQQQQETDQRLRELGGKIDEAAAAATAAAARAANADKAQLQSLETASVRAAAEREKLAADIAALGERFDEIGEFVAPQEQDIYEAAFADYQRREYALAAAGFQRMLTYYPDGQFNGNARYWMSLSLLEAGEYASAAETARQLIALHAGGDKIPDAMLVLARALQNLQQEEESRATLEQLLAEHPTTLAADHARQLLSPPSP